MYIFISYYGGEKRVRAVAYNKRRWDPKEHHLRVYVCLNAKKDPCLQKNLPEIRITNYLHPWLIYRKKLPVWIALLPWLALPVTLMKNKKLITNLLKPILSPWLAVNIDKSGGNKMENQEYYVSSQQHIYKLNFWVRKNQEVDSRGRA